MWGGRGEKGRFDGWWFWGRLEKGSIPVRLTSSHNRGWRSQIPRCFEKSLRHSGHIVTNKEIQDIN